MADFSKQWCEINDPEMPWDFDIIEIASELEPGYCTHGYICEGFGFIAIGKDENNNIMLLVSANEDEYKWVDADTIING